MKRIATVKIASIEELEELLKYHKIRYKRWVKGPKDIESLSNEIQTREVTLKLVEIEGKTCIVRYASRAQIDIRSVNDGHLLVLVEKNQEYPNGHKRIRAWNAEKDIAWYRSSSEKMREGETPLRGALRAFLEELSIHDYPPELLIPCKTVKEDLRRSKSYPGLWDRYTNYRFFTLVPPSFWKPKYLEEHSNGRVTTFLWESV